MTLTTPIVVASHWSKRARWRSIGSLRAGTGRALSWPQRGLKLIRHSTGNPPSRRRREPRQSPVQVDGQAALHLRQPHGAWPLQAMGRAM